jgi:hypothetical protein
MLTALSAEPSDEPERTLERTFRRPAEGPGESLEVAVQNPPLDALEFFLGDVPGVFQCAKFPQLLQPALRQVAVGGCPRGGRRQR